MCCHRLRDLKASAGADWDCGGSMVFMKDVTLLISLKAYALLFGVKMAKLMNFSEKWELYDSRNKGG